MLWAGMLLVLSEGTAPTRAPVYTVPLEILPTRHAAVQVTVNSKGPFRLIFDTGAPTTIVSSRLAREAGLLDASASNVPTLFGMRPRVAVESIALGEALVRNMRVDVLDHPTVEMIEEVSGRLDGIVGLSVFGRFRTTIDYQASRIALEPSGYEPPDILSTVLNRLMTRTLRQVLAPRGLWGLVLDAEQAAKGVRVTRVLAGSPAASAGIRAGDVIVSLDRRWVENVQDCFEAASLAPVGAEVPVTVVRDGRRLNLKVVPADGL